MPRIALAVAVLASSLFAHQDPAPLPLRGELPAIGTVGDAPVADTLTIELHDDGGTLHRER